MIDTYSSRGLSRGEFGIELEQQVDRVQAWVHCSHEGQKGQQHHSLGSS